MNLYELLPSLKNSTAPAALSPDGEFSGQELYSLSCGIIEVLPETDEFLLCCEESILFTAALLALLHSGKKICLPPNSSPGTLNDLAEGRVLIDRNWLEAVKPTDKFQNSCTGNGRISLFTSGSTGQRKEIHKTPEQLQAEINVLGDKWKVFGPVIATVSHQHIYGLLFKILWPLCSGRPFYSDAALYEDDLNHLFSQYPESCLISCPAHLDALVCFNDNDFIKGKTVFSSGAPLNFKTAAKMKKLCGESPVEVFGSTETGGIAWRRQTECATWTLLNSVEIRTVDEQLEVKSPFTGIEGWCRTGDKVEICGNRKFKHLGRCDRISKVSGKRLSLTEMENKLKALDLIENVRIVTLQENSFTKRESSAACCVLSQKGKEVLKKTGRRKFCRNLREKLMDYFDVVTLPRFWRFPEKIPCDSQGKTPDYLVRILFTGIGQKNKRFPDILSLETGITDCSVKFFVPKELIFFDGHFDDQPILPGVTQVFWAEYFTHKIFGLNKTQRISKLKFSKIIFPEKTVEMNLQVNDDKVSFRLFEGNKAFSSGVLHYE